MAYGLTYWHIETKYLSGLSTNPAKQVYGRSFITISNKKKPRNIFQLYTWNTKYLQLSFVAYALHVYGGCVLPLVLSLMAAAFTSTQLVCGELITFRVDKCASPLLTRFEFGVSYRPVIATLISSVWLHLEVLCPEYTCRLCFVSPRRHSSSSS